MLTLAAQAALAVERDAPEFDVRFWSPPTGVQAIAQSPDGMLWLATATGLQRFDGVRFTRFDAGLGLRFVRDLLIASDGGVLLTTGAGMLDYSGEVASP